MRVLVADDDSFSSSLLEAMLRSAGYTCVIARNGREAWDILQAPDAPRIALLDWMMPEIDGVEICRRIRERASADYTYVAILSTRNKQRDIALGFQSGADDFITKPYKPDDVLARLRVAERLLRSISGRSGLARAIAEARESPGGDVIVRTLRRVGRIIFQDGRIAWAHVSDEPGSLVTILSAEPGISRDDVRAVLEECSVSGQNFADVLVAWGLLTQERLRELLRDWLRRKIATIAAFPLPVVLFSPESRAATGGVLFEPEEVLPPELGHDLDEAHAGPDAAAAAVVPPIDGAPVGAPSEVFQARLSASLDKALAIDGARSAAVYDLRSGQCLAARGEALDLDLVWSQLRLASQGEFWEELEDVMISTRSLIYLVRWYTQSPGRLIFLALERTTPLGLARRGLAQCVVDGNRTHHE